MIAAENVRAAYKYVGKATFCFGYAKAKLLNNKAVGIKCKVLDYSGRRIVNMNEWEAKEKKKY